MSPSLGLSHGEIVVAAGLIALSALAVASVVGFTVAYVATREPKPRATAANLTAPHTAVAVCATPDNRGHPAGRPSVAAG